MRKSNVGVFVYKIQNDAGLYSTSGWKPKWVRGGKTFSSVKDACRHVIMNPTIYRGCKIVKFFLAPMETILVDSIVKESNENE